MRGGGGEREAKREREGAEKVEGDSGRAAHPGDFINKGFWDRMD